MDLETFFEQGKGDLLEGIRSAQAELRPLRERVAELEVLIARAQAALGDDDLESDLTLHAALEIVLADRKNAWTSAKELAAEINQLKLYAMKDGRPVAPGQIHERVRNYAHLFEKSPKGIRMRYLFRTNGVHPTEGAYWAATTEIRRVDDRQVMVLETRLAYGAAQIEGQTPEDGVAELSAERARELVKRNGFEPNSKVVELRSSHGWETVQ